MRWHPIRTAAQIGSLAGNMNYQRIGANIAASGDGAKTALLLSSPFTKDHDLTNINTRGNVGNLGAESLLTH